jgi:hypothetical protein
MSIEAWTVILDPAAAIENRVELNLNTSAIRVQQAGIDWGEAKIAPYLAEQQYGEYPVSFRVPNRIVTIPLGLGMGVNEGEAGEEKARAELQEKVGTLQREGGVLLRQRGSGEPLYADIANASLTLPDKWAESGGIEVEAQLVLECLPDFYGPEQALEKAEGAGFIDVVLQHAHANAVIAGDQAARTTISLHNPSANDQRGLLWCVRSKHYSSAATAKLAYGAEVMTPINGAAEASHSGAYGGKWVTLAEPIVGVWQPMLVTDLSAGKEQLTHTGSYRVWARCYAGAAGQRVRLSWSLDDATVPTQNEAITFPAASAFYLVDLGTVTLGEAPVGTHWWRGAIEVETGGATAAFSIDEVFLIALDDAAGKLQTTLAPSLTTLSREVAPAKGEEKSSLKSGRSWSNAANLVAPERGNGSAYATTTLEDPSNEASAAIVANSCGLGIPSGATIEGIAVKLACALASGGTRDNYATGHLQLLKAGALAGTAKTFPIYRGITNEVNEGGATSLWGTTWTAAQVSESAFGFAFWIVQNEFITGSVAYEATRAEVTVYFALSGGFPTIHDAVVLASRNAALRYDGCFREDATSEGYVSVAQTEGDLPRLPPSGMEDKPVELFVKGTHGGFLTPEEEGEPDSTIDTLEATVSYQPSYIGRT